MCHCDNQSVVDVVRGGYGRDSRLTLMLRCLFFLEAKFDCSLSAMHVLGIQNEAADSISRNNLNKFFHLNPQAQPQPSQIPADLVGRPPSNRKPLDRTHLEGLVRDLVTESLAPSTRRMYASGQKRYLSFC